MFKGPVLLSDELYEEHKDDNRECFLNKCINGTNGEFCNQCDYCLPFIEHVDDIEFASDSCKMFICRDDASIFSNF